MRNIYVNDIEFINSISTLKIDTPDGLQEIGDTVIKTEMCSRLITNNTIIEVANNHMFLKESGEWSKLSDLEINDKLKTKNSYDLIESIVATTEKKVYDFEVLHKNHRYYSNNLISHNTGKTMLTLMAALAATRGENRNTFYERILVTKPPVSINRDMYTGYKPGSSEEKMSGHLGGIKSNLKFLLDKEVSGTKKSKKPTNDNEDKPSDTAWTESFGIIEIDEIQGTSLHNTILLVDEFQLLDTDTLFLVLSRISEGSKVVLIGDTEAQTYGMNRANEGFKTLFKHLGDAQEFNYIKLSNIYRSKLAKFVENIFTD